MTRAFNPEPLDEVLDAIDEALGRYEDVCDGPRGEPTPNWAMDLRRRLRDTRAMDAARVDGLVRMLKICSAALKSTLDPGGRITPEICAASAHALVGVAASIAAAEGAPFALATSLVDTMCAARDAIDYMLPRVDLSRAGGLDMRRAERALVDLMRLVGPSPAERRIQAWVDAYAGVEQPRQSADVTPADVELYSHR